MLGKPLIAVSRADTCEEMLAMSDSTWGTVRLKGIAAADATSAATMKNDFTIIQDNVCEDLGTEGFIALNIHVAPTVYLYQCFCPQL